MSKEWDAVEWWYEYCEANRFHSAVASETPIRALAAEAEKRGMLKAVEKMAQLKRWNCRSLDGGGTMEADDNGDYIRYEDVAAIERASANPEGEKRSFTGEG